MPAGLDPHAGIRSSRSLAHWPPNGVSRLLLPRLAGHWHQDFFLHGGIYCIPAVSSSPLIFSRRLHLCYAPCRSSRRSFPQPCAHALCRDPSSSPSRPMHAAGAHAYRTRRLLCPLLSYRLSLPASKAESRASHEGTALRVDERPSDKNLLASTRTRPCLHPPLNASHRLSTRLSPACAPPPPRRSDDDEHLPP